MRDAGHRGAPPRPGPARPPSPPVLGVALLLLAVVTDRIGPRMFATFAAVVSGLAAVELASALRRQGAVLQPLLAGLGAAAFPVGATIWGELGIPVVAGVQLVAFSGGLAIRGLRPGTVRSLASLVLAVVYAGLGGAFVVLVRAGGGGMLDVLLGMVVAYRLGAWLVARRETGTPAPTRPVAGGAAACILVAPLLQVLLDGGAPITPMLGLGVLVGLGATIGLLAGLLLSVVGEGTRPAPRPVLAQVEPVLLAAPAFFYAFHLLLT